MEIIRVRDLDVHDLFRMISAAGGWPQVRQCMIAEPEDAGEAAGEYRDQLTEMCQPAGSYDNHEDANYAIRLIEYNVAIATARLAESIGKACYAPMVRQWFGFLRSRLAVYNNSPGLQSKGVIQLIERILNLEESL